MKAILFCTLPYDFSILKPLADALKKRGHEYLWYTLPSLFERFPYKSMMHTNSLELVEEFQADVIFTPSGDIPYWLNGLKVHLFHGLSGENDAYYESSDCFDLYLTPSPYFTKQFDIAQNFEVIETGWSKLDALFTMSEATQIRKIELLEKHSASSIVLYAPTFFLAHTSARELQETIQKLGDREEILVIVKFHDKMDLDSVQSYRELEHPHILITEESDIIPFMQMADIMISDTSSVVYEFLLLDKPLITFKSHAEKIGWSNLTQAQEVYLKVIRTIQSSSNTAPNRQRDKIIAEYHPYTDSESSNRMIDAVEQYIEEHGVPKERKLPLMQKWKIYRKYNKLR